MAANYVLLEKITVGANGASSVTFNNIPQTGYTDLYIRYAARDSFNATACGTYLYFNTDRSTSYSVKRMYGNGSLPYSDQYSAISATLAGDIPGLTANASLFSNTSITIANYTSSLAKTISIDAASENNTTGAYIELLSGLWNPATNVPINAVTILSGGVAFVQYSSFSLYGVANSTTNPTKAPKAKGGDIIQNDGTYWYHAFLNNGTFIPSITLSCDVLVVGGGGSAGSAAVGTGYNGTGGGGAGGVIVFSSQALSSNTSYPAVIGAGAAPVSNAAGANGSNSQFSSLTPGYGGGGGGYDNANVNALSGGSGGGAANYNLNTYGGSSTQTSIGGNGYGNAGGNVINAGNGGAAGGGGAGASGSSVGASTAGVAGGNGISTMVGWAGSTPLQTALLTLNLGQNVGGTYYIAGGGGGGSYSSTTGGAGGYGGGGQAYGGGASSASSAIAGAAGTANTGCGGGGTGSNGSVSMLGGAGGSGLIIVRYSM